MMFHIKLMYSVDEGECIVNLTKNELLEHYVDPYLKGEDIIANGSIIDLKRLWKIRITQTENSIDGLINEIKLYNSQLTGIDTLFSGDPKWEAIDKTTDVTNQFLNIPPKKIINSKTQVIKNENYIDEIRINELKQIQNLSFDLSKLIRLCEEININWQYGNYYSVIALLRTIINHIPPIFGFKTFEQLANNYKGGLSFKKVMLHLLSSLKNIADIHLHSQVQKNEVLPNNTQVEYKNDIDLLLSEIVKHLK